MNEMHNQPKQELLDQDTAAHWIQRYESALLGVFGTPKRVLVRGSGAKVWDAEGREYLDLLGGIAVNALGHADPFVTSVISSQFTTLGHISNFFTSPAQIGLAEKLLDLVQAPHGSRVFFGNSGTEAIEAAYKLARAYGSKNGRGTLLALEGAFHGRSIGALSLTAKAAYREPFEPLPTGVKHLPFGDVAALENALAGGDVAALFLEPIQGEAGVRPLPPGYLAAARRLTREHGALLIADEVQTGIGRTGAWFAYPAAYGPGFSPAELPDAFSLAKGLGAGFPVSAMLTVGTQASGILEAGTHGTTFGGNPPAAAAALATLHVIESRGLLKAAQDRGEQLRAGLEAIPDIAEVRGNGLLIGFDLATDVPNAAAALVATALEAGFIINAPREHTIRIAPPLILSEGQAASFLDALPGLIPASFQQAAQKQTAPTQTVENAE